MCGIGWYGGDGQVWLLRYGRRLVARDVFVGLQKGEPCFGFFFWVWFVDGGLKWLGSDEVMRFLIAYHVY